mgnify:CR=1 FL=1
MKLSIFVKESRKTLGLTQHQLSKIINKERSNISHYERGISTPPGDVVFLLFQLRFPELCLSDSHSNPECPENATKIKMSDSAGSDPLAA